jgi:hypothetical protein
VASLQHWLKDPAEFHHQILTIAKKDMGGEDDEKERDVVRDPGTAEILAMLIEVGGHVCPHCGKGIYGK